MRVAGYWVTGIAAIVAALAGWNFGQRDRVTGAAVTRVVFFLWFFAFYALIENCGAGGGCEDFANWPEGKAARFVLATSIVTGLVAAFVSRARRRRATQPPNP